MKTIQQKIKLSATDSAKVKKRIENIENKSTTIVLLCHLLRLSGEPYPDFVKLIKDIREGFENIDKVERELLDHLSDEWCGLDRCDDDESFNYFLNSMDWDVKDTNLLNAFNNGQMTVEQWSDQQVELEKEFEPRIEKAVA